MKLVLSLLALISLAYCGGPICDDGGIVGTSEVIIGVAGCGELNTDYFAVPSLGLPGADPAGVGDVGVRNFGGTLTGTEKGCLCEGWGVSSDTGPIDVTANQADGSDNVATATYTGTDGLNGFANAVVTDTSGNLRVTHDYFATDKETSVYECDVTIENIGAGMLTGIKYRRCMDWDTDPNPFAEFVTIIGTTNPDVADFYIQSNDDGFCDNSPLAPCSGSPGTNNVDFVDNGPADHGASFDFGFGDLEAGASVTFKIYYGVGFDNADTDSVIANTGVAIYSLGKSAVDGTPITFFFGFDLSPGGGCAGLTSPSMCPKDWVASSSRAAYSTMDSMVRLKEGRSLESVYSDMMLGDAVSDRPVIDTPDFQFYQRSVEEPASLMFLDDQVDTLQTLHDSIPAESEWCAEVSSFTSCFNSFVDDSVPTTLRSQVEKVTNEANWGCSSVEAETIAAEKISDCYNSPIGHFVLYSNYLLNNVYGPSEVSAPEFGRSLRNNNPRCAEVKEFVSCVHCVNANKFKGKGGPPQAKQAELAAKFADPTAWGCM